MCPESFTDNLSPPLPISKNKGDSKGLAKKDILKLIIETDSNPSNWVFYFHINVFLAVSSYFISNVFTVQKIPLFEPGFKSSTNRG